MRIHQNPWAGLLMLCMAITACGTDQETSTPIATGTPTPAPAPTGDTQASASPRFLVHSAVQGPDGRSNFFSAVNDLAAQRTLDYAQALELPGRARLFAEPGIGTFALGDAESVSITRYELTDDGQLKAGARLSLQAYGVMALEPQGVHFVSPTKAYYKDSGQAQVIVFNPSLMTVQRSIPLPSEILVPDQLTTFSKWATRPGEAYFAVGAVNKDYTRVPAGSALVRLDTQTDALTTAKDARCRGIHETARIGDTLYFFSDVINGLGHAVYPNEGGQADCMLRVSPGQQRFDPDFVGSFASALGGRIGCVASVTAAGEAWLQVVEPTTPPTAPGTTYDQWYGAGWRWVHMPLATQSSPVEVDLPPGAFSSFTVSVGTQFFVSQTTADYGRTTLTELSSGAPRPGLSFSGFALDAARVR